MIKKIKRKLISSDNVLFQIYYVCIREMSKKKNTFDHILCDVVRKDSFIGYLIYDIQHLVCRRKVVNG